MDELDLQVLSAWTENMYDFVKVIMDHMKRPQRACKFELSKVTSHKSFESGDVHEYLS